MRRWLLIVVLVLGLLWLAQTATAQTETRLLSINPANLTIQAVGGKVDRTLMLRASSAITDLQVTTSDLFKSDNSAVANASRLTARLPSTNLVAGQVVNLPVSVDLNGLPSGEYSGSLLFSYQGGSISVAVTLKVKDDFWLPALVLLFSTLLAGAVSYYRSRGLRRDRTLLREQRLRQELTDDPTLAAPKRDDVPFTSQNPFSQRVEAQLRLMARKISDEQWDAADTAMNEAELTLDKWRRGGAGWVNILTYITDRAQECGNPPTGRYLRETYRKLEQAWNTAPDQADPAALSNAVEIPAVWLDYHRQTQQAIAIFSNLSGDRQQVNTFSQQLDDSSPTAGERTILKAVEAAIEQLSRSKDVDAASVKGSHTAVPPPVGNKLAASLQGKQRRFWQQPAWWLAAFRVGTFVLATLLLAMTGFVELYVNQSTFGGFVSYFGLVFWGFGAEATRAAVVDVGRDLGVPMFGGSNKPNTNN